MDVERLSKCAACGLPGHRYGRNEGMDRYDPMACINQLRGELERRGTVTDEMVEAGWRAYCKAESDRHYWVGRGIKPDTDEVAKEAFRVGLEAAFRVETGE